MLDKLAGLFADQQHWPSQAADRQTLLTQLLTHGVLGFGVWRTLQIPGTGMRWHDAEGQGACALITRGADGGGGKAAQGALRPSLCMDAPGEEGRRACEGELGSCRFYSP